MTRVLGLEAELLDLRGDKLGRRRAAQAGRSTAFRPTMPLDNPSR
jgi:hypothetical protein